MSFDNTQPGHHIGSSISLVLVSGQVIDVRLRSSVYNLSNPIFVAYCLLVGLLVLFPLWSFRNTDSNFAFILLIWMLISYGSVVVFYSILYLARVLRTNATHRRIFSPFLVIPAMFLSSLLGTGIAKLTGTFRMEEAPGPLVLTVISSLAFELGLTGYAYFLNDRLKKTNRKTLLRNPTDLKIVDMQFPQNTVIYVAAEGQYVRVVTSETSKIFATSLSRIEMEIEPSEALRVHRSYLVWVNSVAEIEELDDGSVTLVMKNGHRLPVSRRRRQSVIKRLK